MSAINSRLDTVSKKLLYWSKTQPDKPAFIFHNPATATNKRLVFTRADIFTLASRYAAILRREGIRQGDVVCNTLPKSPERLLTDLGIMLAGAVAMNGMVVLSDGAGFVGCIQRSGCVAVILDPKQKHNPLSVLESRNRSRTGHTVDCPDAPLFKTLLFLDCGLGQDGHKPFLEQLRNENESFVADVKPEDRAFIFTTSGSTGLSKLVPRSHAEYLVTERMTITYGSTECGFLTTKLVDLDNKGDYEEGNNGLPLPGLVDENQQEVVEPGQTGEVLCRGPNVFAGYLGMDQAPQGNVFTHDGWFRTSDVGFRNAKGELHIVCRKYSVVIVPVPDPIKYQELCACVVPQPGVSITDKEIGDFCKSFYLNPKSMLAAVPRYYLFFDSFPTTVTGKTDRKAVLTSALRTLGMTHTQPTVATSNTQ
nr:hypothetical protein BaRGS_004794 [Batillaria attramentaria]